MTANTGPFGRDIDLGFDYDHDAAFEAARLYGHSGPAESIFVAGAWWEARRRHVEPQVTREQLEAAAAQLYYQAARGPGHSTPWIAASRGVREEHRAEARSIFAATGLRIESEQ